jgi:hypothetical protein
VTITCLSLAQSGRELAAPPADALPRLTHPIDPIDHISPLPLVDRLVCRMIDHILGKPSASWKRTQV